MNASVDPANWYADADPFVVVRHFAREEISNGAIRTFLDEKSIQTLQHLFNESETILPILQKGSGFCFGAAIHKALGRPRTTAEQILGEAKIVFDETCIPKKCYDFYAAEAVSVDPPVFPKENETKPNFSLVLGSSGSGKTLFAIRRIPELLFGMDETTYVRLHFRASKPTNLINKHKEKAKSLKLTEQTLDFPKAVSAIVDEMVGQLLSGKGLEDTVSLNIPIHITIDEAGAQAYKPYLDTAEKIEDIVTAVKNEGKFKFLQGVHVTVAGTRLETITSDIVSSVETTKFWMQAWTPENFDALVEKSPHPLPVRVKQVVHGFPILDDLTTNARCAFYVLEYLENVSLLRENRVKSSVPVIVAAVADAYIANNVLAHIMQYPKETWQVARSVFRALDQSTKSPGVAFFPHFDDLGTEQLRSIAGCVLDVRVESKQGVPQLAKGSRFAITMTPAIAIVLANLLTIDTKMSWDWHSFDTIVMLSEMKRMIARSQHVPKYPDRFILQLPSPLPDDGSQTRVSIPVVDKYTVVLNGPEADYANVIAPYRLVRTKFSKDNHEPFALDLQGELDTMGLTHSSDHVLYQFITSVFWKFWEKGQEAPPGLDVESIPQLVNKDFRFECYPFNSLNKKVICEKPRVVKGSFNGKKWVLKNAVFGKRVESSTSFDPDRPVTAVFATNCGEFRFNVKRDETESIEEITIKPADIDWEGTVKEEGGMFSKLGLRENVKICFLF